MRKGLEVTGVLTETDGRIIKARVNGTQLINVYAPSGKAKQEMRGFFLAFILRLSCRKMLIVGYSNAVENKNDKK